MGIAVETAQGIGVAVFGFKHDGGVCRFDEPTLAGDSEFCGEIGMDMGDGVKRCGFCHNNDSSFILYSVFSIVS